jgi:hypothetical protein
MATLGSEGIAALALVGAFAGRVGTVPCGLPWRCHERWRMRRTRPLDELRMQ